MICNLPVTFHKSENQYQKWFESLRVGQSVLVQHFHPVSKSVLDSPCEFWIFNKVEINFIEDDLITVNGRMFRSQTMIHRFKNGKMTYINTGGIYLAKVFPVRLVPFFSEFEKSYLEPVYEPEWGLDRVHLFCPSKTEANLERKKIVNQEKFTYEYPVKGGMIMILFADLSLAKFEKKYPDLKLIKYLYSESTIY